MVRNISLIGIKSPNILFLIENILKNSDKKEEIRFIISEGTDTGLESLIRKYGYTIEKSITGKTIEISLSQSGQKMQEVDVSTDVCPGPVITVGALLKVLPIGERLKVICNSLDSVNDISAAVKSSGSKVVSTGTQEKNHYLIIEKADKPVSTGSAVEKEKVLIVQSNGIGNAERAYATFLFAQVAQSMNKPVTIFLLMDGVSIAKKENAASVKHPAFKRMDYLMQEVISAGATIFACELSASFRGIKDTDLTEGVKLAGAATYLQLLSDPSFSIVNF